MFPQRAYPCDHAMLETVYTRILPERGHAVVWIAKAGAAASHLNQADWNGTAVHLLPAEPRARWWNRPPVLLRRFSASLAIAERLVASRGINLVQVRNDLTAAAVSVGGGGSRCVRARA